MFDPGEIEVGVIETSGQLSLLKKAPYKPVTAQDLNLTNQAAINTPPPGMGKELILNGQIISANLSCSGHTEDWLR